MMRRVSVTEGFPPPSATALTDARQAVRLAQAEPHRARAIARSVLRRAHHEPEAVAMAEHALGLAARELNDVSGASDHLRRAVDLCEAAGLSERCAEARMSLSLVLAYAGDTAEALRQADAAAEGLRGVQGARLQAQRAVILQRLGRTDEALAGYRRALGVMRRAGDRGGEARVFQNRGVLRGAEADLRRAETRFVALGMSVQAADVRHNLGFVAARRGDVVAALQLYDEAQRQLRRLGVERPEGLLDRCETLLSVRLVDEARQVGEAAARQLEAAGMAADLAEARLMLSQAALLAGDSRTAEQLPTLARRTFVRQGRPGWAALARYAWLRAVGPSADARYARAASETVDELARAGWVGPALEARLVVARIALARGQADEARAALTRASRARRSGPADLRARAWQAEALLRQAAGDLPGTERALVAGIRALAQNRATLGATELRVHAAAQAEELAGMGLGMALASGRPDRVLGWAERWRAGALWARPVRPSADAEVAAHLTELRRLVGMVEAAGFEGSDASPLLRRQAALEAEIRRKLRHARGDGSGGADPPPTVEKLSPELGDAVLVELVDSGSELHAVTVRDGRAGLHRLGRMKEVRAEVDSLRFALGRLARPGGAAASRSAAAATLRHASSCLDAQLLAPLAGEIGDRSLVVVPTGVLHALPWAALPSCRGRPLSVAPSAAVWLRARNGGRRSGGATVLVAGPDLVHASVEVAELAGLYPGGTVLQGGEATAKRVAAALDGADLAHVAAHGVFRADNPLFSCLRLADGPLTVYDLEGLRQAPRRVVLSACDAGLSEVRPGAELMGASSALFALGTGTLVASVVAVPDALTRPLMLELHRRLARDEPPAVALAGAQEAQRADGEDLSTSAGFVCFGAG